MVSVHKFGGTSVAGADQFKQVANIIEKFTREEQVVVVVSAMAGITNLLYSAIESAVVVGDYVAILEKIKTIHFDCIEKLGCDKTDLQKIISQDIARIQKLLETVHVFGGTCPLEISDIVAGYGEIWSSQILASLLNSKPIFSRAVNARDFLFLQPGKDVRVDWKRSIAPKPSFNEVLVITGFLATSCCNTPTTLKRNGSDFSGAIVANLFDASSLTIWTDVDGIFSADPRHVKGAQMIAEMSYKEAAELAYFGAKVIHPQTMAPCVVKNIPIVLRNTFNLNCPGTLISQESLLAARAVTMIPEIALINVEGSGLFGFSGIAAKLFSSVSNADSNIIMITQASSEYSICFAVPRGDAEICGEAVKRTFATEMSENSIDVTIDTSSCIIAAVGDNMHQQVGLLGRLTSALGASNINIRAIAQGSSERNITLVVSRADGLAGLQCLHDAL
jgi:aspartokinase/homoserine dehydrogenase 1